MILFVETSNYCWSFWGASILSPINYKTAYLDKSSDYTKDLVNVVNVLPCSMVVVSVFSGAVGYFIALVTPTAIEIKIMTSTIEIAIAIILFLLVNLHWGAHFLSAVIYAASKLSTCY